MTNLLRWSAAVLAGLCWVVLARLAGDVASAWTLTLPLMAPPVVVAAFRLPRRAGAVVLALVALLYDAGTGAPFGLSATVALPLHAVLYPFRKHAVSVSGATLGLAAAAITPGLHLAGAFVAGLATRRGMTGDLAGFVVECAVGGILAGLATPWLAGLTAAMLRAFGMLRRGEEPVS